MKSALYLNKRNDALTAVSALRRRCVWDDVAAAQRQRGEGGPALGTPRPGGRPVPPAAAARRPAHTPRTGPHRDTKSAALGDPSSPFRSIWPLPPELRAAKRRRPRSGEGNLPRFRQKPLSGQCPRLPGQRSWSPSPRTDAPRHPHREHRHRPQQSGRCSRARAGSRPASARPGPTRPRAPPRLPSVPPVPLFIELKSWVDCST